MTDCERLLEEASSAWRPHGSGEILPHPAWADLDAAGRLEAFATARLQRRLESALDAGAPSSTGHAVLRRIRRDV